MSADGGIEAINDDDVLLRRVHPSQVVTDKNSGALRPSSAVFKSPEMSVDCHRILQKQDLDETFSLKGFPEHSLVSFDAAFARGQGQFVVHSPISGANEAHTEVRGKKSKEIAYAFVAYAVWVVKR